MAGRRRIAGESKRAITKETAPTLSTEFWDVARRTSEMIAAGGLKADPMASQTGEAAWPLLAEINAAGMLTNDSQPGETDERAYVAGFLPDEATAIRFVDYVNMHTDKVALILPGLPQWRSRPITVTRAPGGKSESRIPLGLEDHSIRFERKTSGLDGDADGILVVYVFDPVWERNAVRGRDALFPQVLHALRETVSSPSPSRTSVRGRAAVPSHREQSRPPSAQALRKAMTSARPARSSGRKSRPLQRPAAKSRGRLSSSRKREPRRSKSRERRSTSRKHATRRRSRETAPKSRKTVMKPRRRSKPTLAHKRSSRRRSPLRS